ncbi:Tigger transposable element-derived protein 6 [Astathelohania contejeani]|uniref:Tigger transposable element-derived protein 6 n=1 Tax=Astathelohania contejeani TaxID=164912 RepID=A0ABQ7HUX5_9MICR|nr:Tigger transposable element-derived protein 6 [Thelohania contejeani]
MNARNKKIKNLKYSKLDEKLLIWFDTLEIKRVIINDQMINKKSQQLAVELGYHSFKSYKGYLEKFKRRHGIRLRKLHGEMKRDDKVDLSSFMTILNQKIVEYTEEKFFLLDDSGLFYILIPSKTLCKKSSSAIKIF